MKAGVLQFFSWPERRVEFETVHKRALERIEIMDKTGYDAVWLAEHHFSTYSVCPSVHMMGMQVAAMTKNLRIGTAVSLAAFYHPLRLAEEVAMLDIFSDGRVNWGAGRSFDPTEFSVFGVEPEENSARFRENDEIVIAAWSNDRLTYDIEVLPKPKQDPHPPVWLAASSPDSILAAARKGHSILMDPHASHVEIGRKRQLYQDELEANGYSIEGRELPMTRLIATGETDAEGEEIARSGGQWTVGSYATGKRVDDEGKPVDLVKRYVDDVVIHGSVDSVVDQIQRLREGDQARLPALFAAQSQLVHALHRAGATARGLAPRHGTWRRH